MDCSIIIPVGPGHEETHRLAVDSVRIATMDKGPFDRVNIAIVDDLDGEKGRSKARNEGIDNCDAEYLFFLDADDRLHPYAFRRAEKWVSSGYDAVFGAIWEIQFGVAVWRYQVPEIRSKRELCAFSPYMTLQMGHFVRSSAAKALRFNEDMDTGEDWDYYLRLWEDYKCIKIDKPLFLNDRSSHSTGPRSANGPDWWRAVSKLLEKERERFSKEHSGGEPVHRRSAS